MIHEMDIWDRMFFVFCILGSFLVMIVFFVQVKKAIDNALELREVKREKASLEQKVKYLESMIVEDDGKVVITWEEGE